MKKMMVLFLAMYATTMVVACGSSNNNSNNGTAAVCPPGQYFSNGYCFNGNGSVANYNSLSFTSENYNQRTVTISNGTIYRKFLKEAMAICDRDGYNAGQSSCEAYLNGYIRITLQAPSLETNAARLTVETGPSRSNYGWYNVSAPTAGQLATCGITYMLTGYCSSYQTVGQYQVPRNPLALDMVLSPINNSAGFEARSYGAAGTISANRIIQLQVATGKLQDGYFDYKLAYNGQSGGYFATGRFARCNDASCGLNFY